jgi:hypothetical protein
MAHRGNSRMVGHSETTSRKVGFSETTGALALRLQADAVVHCTPESLLAAQGPFCGLHRNMAQCELNLDSSNRPPRCSHGAYSFGVVLSPKTWRRGDSHGNHAGATRRTTPLMFLNNSRLRGDVDSHLAEDTLHEVRLGKRDERVGQ